MCSLTFTCFFYPSIFYQFLFDNTVNSDDKDCDILLMNCVMTETVIIYHLQHATHLLIGFLSVSPTLTCESLNVNFIYRILHHFSRMLTFHPIFLMKVTVVLFASTLCTRLERLNRIRKWIYITLSSSPGKGKEREETG